MKMTIKTTVSRRLFACLLALLLCAALSGSALAEQRPAPVSVEELNAWTEQLLQRALADKLSVQQTEEGNTVSGNGYMLVLADNDVSADSVVLDAAITMQGIETKNLGGPRQTALAQSAQEILAAFPNDNPSLSGSAEAAILYIDGQLPAPVTVGRVFRSGQTIQVIEHALYYTVDQGVNRVGLTYTLDNGSVTAIRYFASGAMTAQEAQAELAEASALQEKDAYFAYDTQSPKPFAREDLVFSGLDFMALTPDGATTVLGKPLNQQSIQDSNGEQIRTWQWDGAEAVFIFDAKDQFVRTERFTLTGDALPGPRGLRVGESLPQVLARFEHGKEIPTSSSMLYGQDDGKGTYGKLEIANQEGTVYYAIPGEKTGTVVLILRFLNNALANISVTARP